MWEQLVMLQEAQAKDRYRVGVAETSSWVVPTNQDTLGSYRHRELVWKAVGSQIRFLCRLKL